MALGLCAKIAGEWLEIATHEPLTSDFGSHCRGPWIFVNEKSGANMSYLLAMFSGPFETCPENAKLLFNFEQPNPP